MFNSACAQGFFLQKATRELCKHDGENMFALVALLITHSPLLVEGVYGDLGDQVLANVKKSSIPNDSGDHSDFYAEQKSHEVKSLPEARNSLYQRNFISDGFIDTDLGFVRKRSYIPDNGWPRRTPLSVNEVRALHKLHRIIAPNSAHERLTKRTNLATNHLFKQHALSVAKALRSSTIKSFLAINRPLWPITSKNPHRGLLYGRKSNILQLPQKQDLLFRKTIPVYASRRLLPHQHNPMNGLPFYVASPAMLDKRLFSHGNFRIRSYPSETASVRRMLKLHGPPLKSFSERQRFWKPHDRNSGISAELLKKAKKYNGNSLMKELGKVTMKFYDGKNGKPTTRWSAYKEHQVSPSWLSSLKAAIQPKKTGAAKPNKILAQRRLPKPSVNAYIQKMNAKNFQKKQFYMGPKTSDVSSIFLPAYMTQPGEIPWNYYHAEYLPDGRVRPPLYPISQHIPPSGCLPEASLCDKNRHDQCCGAATFCTDFWGISKCLAHIKPTAADYHDAKRMHENTINKNNYNFWLTRLNSKL